MTDLRKSDSQLDAEAAQRRQDTPVGELIEDHRLLYRADLSLPRLHVRDGESGIGPPFSEPFRRHIDWDRKDQAVGVRPTRPGPAAPWITARYAQWAECRRSHPEHHDRPEWRGSLCHALVSWTVVNRKPEDGSPYSLLEACGILGVTVPRAGRTLRNALLWIEASMDHARERDEQRQRDRERPAYKVYDPPKPSEERHDQPGLHREDCVKCRKQRGEAA